MRRLSPPAALRRWLSGMLPGSQLALVAVTIILLLSAAAVAFAWRAHTRAVETAEREVLLNAVAAATDAERFLTARVEMLEVISAAPLLLRGDLGQIHGYLTGVVSRSGFSEVGWIDPSGYALTVGGAAPLQSPLFVGDRPHIARALATGEPVIGQAQISRVSQQPTVNIVVPVLRDGDTIALLAGAVRLNGPKVTDLRFGNVEGLRVLDGFGQIAILGDRRGLTELRSAQEWRHYEAVREQPRGVLHAATGVLGEPDRVVAFSAVPGSSWTILVDRPASDVYATANRTLGTELGLVTMFGASSLLLVAWVASRLNADAERFVLFIDTLTHDAGTPLTVIRAYTARLQRSLRADPSLLNGVIEIDRAGRRMERMIQGLADLLGPERRPELVRTEIDLAALVRDLASEYELRTDRTVRFHPAQREMIGEWDGLRVERLVDNLISNAIKYSSADSEVIVSLSAEQSANGRQAIIQVRDFGIGIPAADLGAVWRRFQRGSNTGGVPGKGVGLASVRQITAEHGGTVHILSTEGKGTVVTVRLPWPEDIAPPSDEKSSEDQSSVLSGNSGA